METSLNTITDSIPCVRATVVCSGTTANDVTWSDRLIVCSGASAELDCLESTGSGGEDGVSLCRFGWAMVPLGAFHLDGALAAVGWGASASNG